MFFSFQLNENTCVEKKSHNYHCFEQDYLHALYLSMNILKRPFFDHFRFRLKVETKKLWLVSNFICLRIQDFHVDNIILSIEKMIYIQRWSLLHHEKLG